MRNFLAVCELKLKLLSANAQIGSKSLIFQLMWPWNLTDDFENLRGNIFDAPRSYACHYIAIWKFKLEILSGNAQIGAKSIFWAHVTLKFEVWPPKIIGNLFHASRSYVCHFIAIWGFALVLSSGRAQISAKLSTFWHVWPWNLTDDLEKQ